jgi:hypothetical protein
MEQGTVRGSELSRSSLTIRNSPAEVASRRACVSKIGSRHDAQRAPGRDGLLTAATCGQQGEDAYRE